MKKIMLLSILMVFAFSGALYAAGGWNGFATVKVVSGGKEVKASEPAIQVKGKTFVPVSILKQLGISVLGDAKKVTLELPKLPVPDPRLPYEQMVEISKNVGIVHAVFPDGTGKQGSGVILPDGVFVTACHVACGASRLSITIDGQTYNTNGQALFQDNRIDVYGVKIDAPSTITINTDTPKVGSMVYAVGYPHGKYRVVEGTYFTTLDLNGLGRTNSTKGRVDAGQSGGALLDNDGELIGLTLSGSNLTDITLSASMYTVMDFVNK